MIDARELRIGNWVYHHHNLGIKIPAILTIGLDIHSHQEFEPIPLTEEILLKWGFEKFREATNWSDWKLGDYRFHFRPKKDCANCFGIQLDGSSGHNIVYFNWNLKYLHQLQNLYFALTGEELNINL